MRLFWRHGFESVSMAHRARETGVAAPTLYATFGTRDQLFMAALDACAVSAGSLDLSVLDGACTLTEAVGCLLDEAVRAVTDPQRERGCMFAIGMLACHPDHSHLAHEMATRRNVLRNEVAIKLQHWTSPARAAPLARYLSTALQGLSVQARDGATPSDLQLVAAEMVAGLFVQTGLTQRAQETRFTPSRQAGGLG
ncbi:helix-turn-helix domain containing protein [Paraburkholderia sediminicola]|uniref:TetR/AcrR family transcriptional regulator n=1 Tax=Paraburkholderia sediminicola TaxID=458836 RepID=UPI0038BA31ED